MNSNISYEDLPNPLPSPEDLSQDELAGLWNKVYAVYSRLSGFITDNLEVVEGTMQALDRPMAMQSHEAELEQWLDSAADYFKSDSEWSAEHGDDAPDPLEEIEIETAEMGDVDDYDQLRIERGEFETENYQLKQQLAAVTAERDALKNQMAEIAKTVRLFIRKEREHANSEYLWHEGLLAILTMTGE